MSQDIKRQIVSKIIGVTSCLGYHVLSVYSRGKSTEFIYPESIGEAISSVFYLHKLNERCGILFVSDKHEKMFYVVLHPGKGEQILVNYKDMNDNISDIDNMFNEIKEWTTNTFGLKIDEQIILNKEH